jgi:hypothetical protein
MRPMKKSDGDGGFEIAPARLALPVRHRFRLQALAGRALMMGGDCGFGT